ncbi:MAG: [LysW]-lysine hydrolase [Euryarchaeota archaeon]|nr:[LysW]-lysine hydrolase [Euryarchaeota archaeon]
MLIEDMVRIYSPTGLEARLAEFLIHWGNEHGFEAYNDKVGNFIAERGENPEILLVGHMDTVSGEIPVRIEDGKLYGRGSVDAKGSLSCFLEAAAVSKKSIRVVGVVEEEGDSRGARHIVDKFDPAYIIIGEPSGWDSLTIGYRGNLTLCYKNKKPKKHSSLPEPNSCEEAVRFFNALKNFTTKYNERKTPFNQLGVKLLSIRSEENGFSEQTELSVNIRIPIGFDTEKLEELVTEHKKGAKIEYSSMEKPVMAGKRNRLVSSFIKAVRLEGGKFGFKVKTGTSDMNILREYNVPIVTYGPGDSRLDHTPNEHLDLAEYKKAVKVMKRVLERI